MSEQAKLTKFQKFEMERWDRSRIKNAPYNPRKMDSYSKKKLQKFVKDFGLLGPVTVNATTGNIVGGHQRLAVTDALEKKKDYSLDVAVVKLTPKQEREANLGLNNVLMQGEWDVPLLSKLLEEGNPELQIDVGSAGFEPMELQITFESAGMPLPESLFQASEESDDAVEAVGEVAPPATPFDGAEAEGDTGEERESVVDEDGNVVPNAEGTWDERKAHVLKQKEGLRKAGVENTDTEYMVIVICRDRADREELAMHLGLGADGKYVDAAKVWHAMGVTRG